MDEETHDDEEEEVKERANNFPGDLKIQHIVREVENATREVSI